MAGFSEWEKDFIEENSYLIESGKYFELFQKINRVVGDYPIDILVGLIELQGVEKVLKEFVNLPNGFFAGSKRLKNIEIPAFIKGTGDHIFMDCHNLERVVFKGPTLLGNSLFLDCDSLKEIVFEDEVKTRKSLYYPFMEMDDQVTILYKGFRYTMNGFFAKLNSEQ